MHIFFVDEYFECEPLVIKTLAQNRCLVVFVKVILKRTPYHKKTILLLVVVVPDILYFQADISLNKLVVFFLLFVISTRNLR